MRTAARRTTMAEESPEFKAFWAVWQPHMRHTDGRGDAREAFRKHILMGADPQDIIDGATGFFRFMQEKDKPYVPLAASWLNKEAYADWAVKERAYQARMAERSVQPQPKPSEPVVNTMTKEEREAAQRRIFEKFGMAGELH